MASKEVAQTIEGAITRAQEKRNQEQLRRTHIPSNEELFIKADHLLARYNDEESSRSGRSTRLIPYEVGQIKTELWLRERWVPVGYERAPIILKAGRYGTIYTFNKNSIESVGKKLKKPEDFVNLNKVLDFMEKSYKEAQSTLEKPTDDESPESTRILLPPVFEEPPRHIGIRKPFQIQSSESSDCNGIIPNS